MFQESMSTVGLWMDILFRLCQVYWYLTIPISIILFYLWIQFRPMGKEE